jgi:NAD-dependent SIR2 family protein deacetylase
MTLPEVAQAYELEMGHQSLIAYVAGRIEDASHAPLRTHQLIAQLPFKRIITTNWDTLLEEALREAHRPFVKVVRDVEMAYADEGKVLLIKLHGSVEQKDTLVITGDDYYDVFARLPQTANLVRSYFASQSAFEN